MKFRNFLVLFITLFFICTTSFTFAGDVTNASRFPTWKTIELGTGLQTADDFRSALKDGGYRVGPWGDDLLGQPTFTVRTTATKIDLVLVTVLELGLTHGASRREILNRAKELGLEPCPAEVGPQLRLQYPNQRQDELLLIGMEPIVESGGNRLVFFLTHDDDGLRLNASYGYIGGFWDSRYRWVFIQHLPAKARQ